MEYLLRQLCKISRCNLRYEDYIETTHKSIKSKALRTFIIIYSLYEYERLSVQIKLTLYKALSMSVMTYGYPAWDLAAYIHLLKLQRLKRNFSTLLKMFEVHTGRRFAHGFQPSAFVRLYNKIVQETSRSQYGTRRSHL
jgi:hypothetical protein